MAKLKWRVRLVAERHPGVVTETELACLERDEDVGVADLGLRLDEAKRLAAALQAEMVPAQIAAISECPRACEACGRRLAAKGHYGATFRSLFGEVSVQVRRLFVCPCRGEGGAKSVAALDFGGDAVAPELACVTARYAALAPFGKVAALLSELLPLGGTQHASTVRNRTLRVGAEVVQACAVEAPDQLAVHALGPVVVGLDGGYVRDRHRSERRRFEVIAGKVIRADETQHRFAFVRDGQVPASEAFRRALAAAGVGAETPATVLCDGDAGLWLGRQRGPPPTRHGPLARQSGRRHPYPLSYRLLGAAEDQVNHILLASAQEWGIEAAGRYHRLMLAVFAALGASPDLRGSYEIEKVAGVRAYPLRLGRSRVERSQRVYRTGHDGVVEVIGVAHDRMLLARAARQMQREAGA